MVSAEDSVASGLRSNQMSRSEFGESGKSTYFEENAENLTIIDCCYTHSKEYPDKGSSFILGDSDADMFGSSILGSVFLAGSSNIRFLEQKFIVDYEENFSGSIYKDSGSTTATWTLGSLTFTALSTPVGSNYPGSTQANAGSYVAWYKFDEGTGTTVSDSTGSCNTGSFYNPSWAVGQWGSSGVFDGTTSKVSLGSPSVMFFNGNISFSLSCWVKPTTPGTGTVGIISGRDNDGGAGTRAWFWGVHTTTGSVYHMRAESASYLTSPIVFDTWNHLAMCYDGSYIYAYKNGICTGSLNNSNAVSCVSTVPINIGVLSNNLMWFVGNIDDFRVWNNYRLTDAEIGSLYLWSSYYSGSVMQTINLGSEYDIRLSTTKFNKAQISTEGSMMGNLEFYATSDGSNFDLCDYKIERNLTHSGSDLRIKLVDQTNRAIVTKIYATFKQDDII